MLLRVIMILLSFAALAAGDEWAKTFNTAVPTELYIETSDANIEVLVWEKNAIETRVISHRATIRELGLQIKHVQNQNSVRLEVKFPRGFVGSAHGRVDVDIKVLLPKDTILHLRTRDGNIGVKGTEGRMTLSSEDGDIVMEDVNGSVQAQSGDGEVRVVGVLHAVQVHTGDGDVKITAQDGSRMNGDWSVRTGDGDLTLLLPKDFSANLDFHTGDGHIELNLPVTVSGRVGRQVRGTINGGGELLAVKTGDGSITLESP